MEIDVLAVIGGGVTAILAAFGYVLKQHNEDRRAARAALFQLLSVREACLALADHPEDLFDKLITELKPIAVQVFGPGILAHPEWSDESIAALGPVFKPLLARLLPTVGPALNGDLQKQYLASLAKLAERHPVLAYKLAGRETLNELFAALEAFGTNLERAAQQVLFPLDAGQDVAQGMRLAIRSISTRAIADLEKDLLELAWVAGICNWLRCQKIARETRQGRFTEAKRAELRAMMTPLLRQLAEQLAAKTRQDAEAHQVVRHPAQEHGLMAPTN